MLRNVQFVCRVYTLRRELLVDWDELFAVKPAG